MIRIRGANENNLKSVDLDIPRNQFIVFTGLSGSGKSSLAFDTIYAEGQRRYMESLSSYARQFLGQMEKPDVESIEGLPPAISIDQKSTNRNPRSTVGTVTEIYDYFRLLYARVGTVHCPKCGKVIKKQTVDQMVDAIMQLPDRTKIQLLAPVVRGRKGTHAKLLEKAKKSGYVRVRIDGNMYELSEEIALEKNIKHNIEIVVDRLVVKEGIEKRLTDSLENVLSLADGLAFVEVIDGELLRFSQSFACPDCGVSVDEIEPRSFSFNNPFGACPDCYGLGYKMEFDVELMIPDPSLSILDGAITVTGWQSCTDKGSFTRAILDALAKEYQFDLATPFQDYPEEIKHVIIHGTDGKVLKVHYKGQRGEGVYDVAFEGLIRNVERRYRETGSDTMKQEYESFMRITPCKTCKGQRLKKEALAVTVGDKNIYEVTSLSIEKLQEFMEKLTLTKQQELIGKQILKEIRARIRFLMDVGLDYLTLARATGTLSGGEAQRIRLATQIGSGLVGVAYILDEPSIGLHQRDNDKLLNTLRNLRDLGNTLIVVEHDEDTMFAADCIVDIGPGAGEHGGKVVAVGNAQEIMACPDSVTGQYLSGAKKIPVPSVRKKPTGWLKVVGAAENNLKNINVDFPLGVMTCVTGVSGSGKSSLVNEILYKHLAKTLNRARTIPGKHKDIVGMEQLDKVIAIDQSPIGRTPRSNPATYTGVFDQIRDLFAATQDAKARGYKKGRFSFNVKGGRCEACSGDGILKIEMHFLPDVYVPCEVCGGKRYNRETLEVKYKGKSIYDVLNMTVEEALGFFDSIPSIKRKIQTLYDVGLSYIRLGQPSTELSGGEAQRIKLATELSKRSTGRTIYILDEPTTGLHFADVHKLIEILQRLAEGGNTVVVIEHNLDVIKTADYIIDIGPKAGRLGGEVVYQGDVNNLRKCTDSHTVRYLTGEDQIEIPPYRRPWNNYIEVTGARKNNLKGVDVKFPLNVMTVVTGVSGSGKSSLVRDIFYEGVKRHLDDAARLTVDCSGISGDLNMIQAIEFVDQNSIGKSSRSNPVTYIGAYDEIRKLFGEQPLAKQMGYNAAYFSFNKEGGRCEECKGEGKITVEMQFMADITLECEACHGKRFKQDVLDVEYQGANIYDVLEMTVNQAIEFFEKGSGSQEKKIVKRLKPLQDVGLGYIKLGQTSSTLSGGENQRVKLAYYLGQEKQQPTLFVFDEPTTGLHFHDIKTLLKAFNALIEKGHSVVIIEHNMDVIKCADYVIDLGPEGGKAGGQLVCAGTPEEIAACEASYTGRFLRDKL
mgnify:CR=1 FL=1